MASSELEEREAGVIRNASLTSWQNMDDLTDDRGNTCSMHPMRSFRRCSDGKVIGCLYAIVLSVLGIAFPLQKALSKEWLNGYIESIFLVYLYGVAFVIFIVLEICLHRQRQLARRRDVDAVLESTRKRGFENANFILEATTSGAAVDQKELRHPAVSTIAPADGPSAGWRRQRMQPAAATSATTAATDEDVQPNKRSSLYLRIGAGIFGLAAMVHTGLLVKQMQEDHAPVTCDVDYMFWTHYAQIAFLFAQTYFVFKHSKINLKKGKPLVRIACMHVVAVNWCIWVRAIIRETLDNWLRHDTSLQHLYNTSDIESCYYEEDIFYKATPFLFPFVVQYSMVVMVAVYILYSNLDPGDQSTLAQKQRSRRRDFARVAISSLHHTHRGLFVGVVVIAGTVVSVTLFFSYLEDAAHVRTPSRIFLITALALCALSVVTVFIAWRNICAKHRSGDNDSSTHNAMLLLSTSGLLLFNVLKIIPVVDVLRDGERDANTILVACDCLASMVLAVLQTAYVVSAQSRGSNHLSKSGRGSVMFLMCTNVALWLLRALQIKELQRETPTLHAAYGDLPGQLIILCLVPFVIYFHFHSSVSLGDIWNCSYQRQCQIVNVVDDDGFPETVSRASYEAPAAVAFDKTAPTETPNVKQHGKLFALALDANALNSPVSDV